MEYVYGAMLLHSAGKKITEENLKKVMTSSGVKVDAARVKAIISALEGVNIDEAIQKAAIVSAPVAPAAPAAEQPTGKPAEAPKEGKEKPTEEEEKKTEEEAASGLSSLFG